MKQIFEKVQDVGASYNSVRVIVTSAVMAFTRKRLRFAFHAIWINRTSFGRCDDYYSEIKLHNIVHIAYKAIEFSTNKKEPTLHSRFQYWNDNEAATDHGGIMADSCIRRMVRRGRKTAYIFLTF